MDEQLLLVLANAPKPGGFCVAGITVEHLGDDDLRLGLLVRAVSSRPHGSYLVPETFVAGGAEVVRPLDVVAMALHGNVGTPAQPENWLTSPGPWRRVRQLDPAAESVRAALLAICERSRTVMAGFGGSVAEGTKALRSLEVRDAKCLTWLNEGASYGGRQVRAQFLVGDEEYALPVTDPLWKERVLWAGPGVHRTEELASGCEGAFLLLSLGELFDRRRRHYKLVAGVIPYAASPRTSSRGA